MEQPVFNAILRRRSVRQYQDLPVERDTLLQLIRAAAAAPSASNRQPWDFVVVQEPQILEQLRQLQPYTNYKAPAAIIVCGNMERAYEGAMQEFWVQDCSAAAENMMLAAVELGLGTCWMGVYPVKAVCEKLAGILELPGHVVPLGLFYVGYPAAQPEPRTQYREDLVHWNRY